MAAKLPEPVCTVTPYEVNHIYWEAGHEQAGCGSSLFTETQMLQFRRDALEEVLQCYSQDDTASDYIGKILDLKDET